MPIQKAPGLVAYAFSRCNYTTSETPRSETSARIEAVAVKMRPTGLGHGVYKDVPDCRVFYGDWWPPRNGRIRVLRQPVGGALVAPFTRVRPRAPAQRPSIGRLCGRARRALDP